MPVESHELTCSMEQIGQTPTGDAYIGIVTPCTDDEAKALLELSPNTGDTRSDFFWLRLPDGTLVLGVFPQGDTYLEVCGKHSV